LVVPVCYVAVHKATVFEFRSELLSSVGITISEAYLQSVFLLVAHGFVMRRIIR